jgi:hypothetical protein
MMRPWLPAWRLYIQKEPLEILIPACEIASSWVIAEMQRPSGPVLLLVTHIGDVVLLSFGIHYLSRCS